MMTQVLVKPQRTEALSYSDRVTIANVLTWDSINGTFKPDDIETICLKGDIAWVKLIDGAYPWAKWKSEDDAIEWALQELPDLDLETLRVEFEKLVPTNGKKAPAWVKRIEQLKEPF